MAFSKSLVIFNVQNLYEKIRIHLDEHMDIDGDWEHYIFSTGHTPYSLFEWWLKHALRDVLALPISGIYPLYKNEELGNHIRSLLAHFESEVFGLRPYICNLDAEWVDCQIVVNSYRLTILIH